MKRIELLNLAHGILNNALSIPPSVFAEKPHEPEWILSKIVSSVIFTVQLVGIKNKVSLEELKFSPEETDVYNKIDPLIKENNLSDRLLKKIGYQLFEYTDKMAAGIKDSDFPATVKLKDLISKLLTKENILDPSFFNLIQFPDSLTKPQEALFGMLITEINLEKLGPNDRFSQMLLAAIQNPSTYEKGFITLSTIAGKISDFRGWISDWSDSIPKDLLQYIQNSRKPIFHKEIRQRLEPPASKIPSSVLQAIKELNFSVQTQAHAPHILSLIITQSNKIIEKCKEASSSHSHEIKNSQHASKFISTMNSIGAYYSNSIPKYGELLQRQSVSSEESAIASPSVKPPLPEQARDSMPQATPQNANPEPAPKPLDSEQSSRPSASAEAPAEKSLSPAAASPVSLISSQNLNPPKNVSPRTVVAKRNPRGSLVLQGKLALFEPGLSAEAEAEAKPPQSQTPRRRLDPKQVSAVSQIFKSPSAPRSESQPSNSPSPLG